MRVARTHGGEARRFGLQIQLREIVQNVDQNAGQFEHSILWQAAGPGVLIDIAANRSHGSNRFEFFQNLRRANVAGVDDVVRPARCVEGLSMHKTMSVGDDADREGSSQFSVLSSQFPVSGFRFPVPDTRYSLLLFHFLHKLADAYDGASHRALANLLDNRPRAAPAPR